MKSWPDRRLQDPIVKISDGRGTPWTHISGPDCLLTVRWHAEVRVGSIEYCDEDGNLMELFVPDRNNVNAQWVRALRQVEGLYVAEEDATEAGQGDEEAAATARALLARASSEDGIIIER